MEQYHLLSPQKVEAKINEVIKSNDVSTLEYLLTNKNVVEPKCGYDHCIYLACYHGNLAALKFLIETPNLPFKINGIGSDYKIQSGFMGACCNGQLHIVEYLTTSAEIIDHVNIFSDDGKGYKYACQMGHTEIVKFLTTSPKLEDHYDIEWYGTSILLEAAKGGHVELLDFALTDPLLPFHPDITRNNNECFKWALFMGKDNVVDYLLYECKIRMTEDIDKYLENSKGGMIPVERVNEIKEKFTKIELFYSLDEKVPNKTEVKKHKI